ncbi:hypothetical protein NHF50_06460 [Flavobacterium sp. NRK F10]|uniref:hypothetical protein n=1 Tax=Flavobacterium sp. NRK F10 TaxID=2954931 RepID=UPI0020905489|nr:hypothetical protein [Flavobacterium sp. NRK F10]MCO6174683.1 hypothetical protein [Flavobacterium sp. NRK F10]
MKKLTFILAISTLSLIAVSCTADDLDIQQDVNNKEIIVDDFDYSLADRDSQTTTQDTVATTSAVGDSDTNPIVTLPKKD